MTLRWRAALHPAPVQLDMVRARYALCAPRRAPEGDAASRLHRSTPGTGRRERRRRESIRPRRGARSDASGRRRSSARFPCPRGGRPRVPTARTTRGKGRAASRARRGDARIIPPPLARRMQVRHDVRLGFHLSSESSIRTPPPASGWRDATFCRPPRRPAIGGSGDSPPATASRASLRGRRPRSKGDGPGPRFSRKPAIRGIGRSRLEELDRGLARGKERRPGPSSPRPPRGGFPSFPSRDRPQGPRRATGRRFRCSRCRIIGRRSF